MVTSLRSNLEWLPESVQERVLAAVGDVERALGDGLVCVALVGAAVHPDRSDRGQLPELVAIAQVIDDAALHRLAEEVHDSMRDGVRLRVMSQRELERSADVFTLELAEYQEHHVLLSGSDVFADLELRDDDLRRSIEQGLRGLGRRVRNRVLTGVATDGRRGDANRAAAQGINRFTVLARHSMRLLGHEPPAEDVPMMRAVAELVGVDGAALLQDMVKLRAGHRLGDPLAVVSDLLRVLEPLVERVDAHDAG